MREFRFAHCGIWYVRFGMDVRQKLLACGNKVGQLFVWDLESANPNPPQRLANYKSTAVVRMTSFNADGRCDVRSYCYCCLHTGMYSLAVIASIGSTAL